MTKWGEIAAAEPAFTDRVRGLFDLRKHKTLASLRRDGSPRISAIEASFDDGELTIGMMHNSMKARDMLRDPRLALHSPTVDPPEEDQSSWVGDAKIAGVAVEVTGERDHHLFRIDITEIVLTYLGSPADHLVIESWHPGRGLERQERR